MLIARATIGKFDSFGATEKNSTQIEAIDMCDSLGYRGFGREEHSGENAPLQLSDLSSELADNELVLLLTEEASKA